MNALAVKLLVAIAILGAIVVSSFRAGERVKNNEWIAKEATRLQAERIARDGELKRGEKAGAQLGIELRDQAIAYDQLQGAFNAYKRKYSILAPASVVARGQAGAGDTTPHGSVDGAAGNEPRLSFGAVWMWNSALVGRDAPAGACGLADPSAASCAAGSGISLEDAWDNQSLNARICAEDRTRHQRLIDFINGRKNK